MRRKSNIQFVMIFLDLLKDPKWRNLSSSAKITYIYMRSKFNRKDLNEISLTYSEMADLMSKTTLSSAFKELIVNEFIKKTKKGGLYGGKCKYKFIGKYKEFYYNGSPI